MAFKFVVTDLAGNSLGALDNASGRMFARAVNRPRTASAKIRTDHRLADAILSGATMLKVYDLDDATPLGLVGQVVAAEEVGAAEGADEGTIALTWSDAYWRLTKRLIGKNPTGYRDGQPLNLIDKSVLLQHVLEACNAEDYTGITVGTITASGATGYVAYDPYKRASDAISELVNGLDGPDFELAPTEPTNVGQPRPQIALLNVAGTIGTSRPDAVFEYGTGRHNVNSYRRAITWDGLLNAAYGLPTDPLTGTVVTASDPTSIAAYGRMEDLVPSDLAVPELRQKLADEHVRVRKVPRTIITFDPSRDDPALPGRVPKLGVDFELGDTVPFRAVKNGVVRVNANLRVYGVTYNIDDNDAAIPVFALTPD